MGDGLHCLIWFAVFLLSASNFIEQGVPYKGTIKPHETQQIIFNSAGGLKRVFYFQCTGSADLAITDPKEKEVVMFKGFVSKTNSNCEETFACNGDPCDFATCPGTPHAQCIPNYCDGCIAEFYVDSDPAICNEPGTAGNVVFAKGAPPHFSVLQFSDVQYTFNLRGKRSSIDSTNTFQLYVYDLYETQDSIIMLGDQDEVNARVVNSTVSLEWTRPVYGSSSEILKHYCLYYLEKPYRGQLQGDWVACGHEIKSSHEPAKCTNQTSATFSGLARNRSHYIWVVAFSDKDTTTAYPFVRIDMEHLPFSRTFRVSADLVLVLISLLLFVLE